MIELGIGQGPDAPRVEKRNYSAIGIAAAEAWAASGAVGAALGAVEVAAGLYGRAFASATVEPAGPRTAALTPAVLADLARRLVTAGESVHLVDVGGGRVTVTAATWATVTGGPRRPWSYTVTVTGPSTTETRTVSGDQIAHCMWAADAVSPWRGRSPLSLAGESGRLARAVESALADETAGPRGTLIAIPADAGDDQAADPGDDQAADPLAPLKREIATLGGKVGLVETTSAGWSEGRAAAPSGDWEPKRIGADPPAGLVAVRQAVESTVLACCGIPPDLARGGRTRESYRQFISSSVGPLARMVETELGQALDVNVRLRFDALGSADVAGRSRAFASLTGGGMDSDEARRLVGFD